MDGQWKFKIRVTFDRVTLEKTLAACTDVMTVEAISLYLNDSTWPPVGKLPYSHKSQTDSFHAAHTAPMALYIQVCPLICYWKQYVENLKHVLTTWLALVVQILPAIRLRPTLQFLFFFYAESSVGVHIWSRGKHAAPERREFRNFLNNLAIHFVVVLNCNMLSWILNASKKLLVEAPTHQTHSKLNLSPGPNE